MAVNSYGHSPWALTWSRDAGPIRPLKSSVGESWRCEHVLPCVADSPSYAEKMANGMWHSGYGIEINLSLPDLGHPDRPDLAQQSQSLFTERPPRRDFECSDPWSLLLCRKLVGKGWVVFRGHGEPAIRAS